METAPSRSDIALYSRRTSSFEGALRFLLQVATIRSFWGVWASQSREDFERLKSYGFDPARISLPPGVGRLCSRIPVYPDTLLLKARVHLRAQGMMPSFELEPTDHPIAIEQRTGITEQRLRIIEEGMKHREYHPEWDKQGFYGGAV